jgi:hypothetical protein
LRAEPRFRGLGIDIAGFRARSAANSRPGRENRRKSLKKAAQGLGDDGTLAYSARAGQIRPEY